MPEIEKKEMGFSKNFQEEDPNNEYQNLLENYDIVDGKMNLEIKKKSQKVINVQFAKNKIDHLAQELNKMMIGVHYANLINSKILVIDFIMMLLSVNSIISSIIYVKKQLN